MANSLTRRGFVAGAPLALAACGGGQSIWAPEVDVQRVMFRGDGPPSLTLYSMLNVGSGSGAHSSLLIDASQRVMFDPAGSFKSSVIPERNDVLFGITPRVEAFYISFHARESYYVEGHRIVVSAEVAEQALRLSLANGSVPKMGCSLAVSGILRQLPGFEFIGRTLFPDTLRDEFKQIPGVTERVYRENDDADKSIAARQIEAALTQGQP